MADAFVSYSRRDQAFVRRLYGALTERGREVWVDWKSIPPSAEWKAEIASAIAAADSFVFVVSPDSIHSRVCREEVDLAAQANKRLIPVVSRDVDYEEIPEPIRSHNWVSFRPEEEFEASLQVLVSAMDTDLPWVRAHTRLLTRATEWDGHGRDKSFVLRGEDLEAAERWLTQASARQEPHPTPLQTQYLIESRRAATRQQRALLGGVSIALVVSLLLGVLAVIKRDEASRQAMKAESRELAASSVSQLSVDPELSVLLALEAIKRSDTEQARRALREAMGQSNVRMAMREHTDDVTKAKFSPDGRWAVSASRDDTAILWDLVHDSTIPLIGHTGDVLDASFDMQSGRVVTASRDKTARVWNLRGEVVSVLGGPGGSAGHRDVVYSAEFSHDGSRVVTASRDHTAIVWNLSGGEPVVLREHEDDVFDAAFSPDDSLVVTASRDRTAIVWKIDGKSAHPIRPLRHKDEVLAVALKGDSVLTTSADGSAWVWNLQTGDHVVLRREEQISTAAFDPSGHRVLTAGHDGVARIWSVDGGRLLLELVGHTSAVLSAAFTPEGHRVITGSRDSTARVWDAGTGELLGVLRGHRGAVNWVASRAEASLPNVLTAGQDHTVRLWQTSAEQTLTMRHDGEVFAASFNPKGTKVVTASADATARIWRLSGTEAAGPQRIGSPIVLRGHEAGLTIASFDPTGTKVVTADLAGKVLLWDAAGRLLDELPKHDGAVLSAAFSPDGSSVVTAGEDDVAYVWEIEDGTTHELRHPRAVVAAKFSPLGDRIITVSRDGNARVWNWRTREPSRIVLGHSDDVVAGAFDPTDGSIAITVERDGTVSMWDVTEPKEALWAYDGEAVASATMGRISPDGRAVLLAGAGTAFVLTLRSDNEPVELPYHSAIRDANFSPDGKMALTAGVDGRVRVWDAATGELRAVLTGHVYTVITAVFSPDGHAVLTASRDHTARLYSCDLLCGPIEPLISRAGLQVTRGLTKEERAEYLHEDAGA